LTYYYYYAKLKLLFEINKKRTLTKINIFSPFIVRRQCIAGLISQTISTLPSWQKVSGLSLLRGFTSLQKGLGLTAGVRAG
jgi:hypothetical protein